MGTNKRAKFDSLISLSRFRSIQILSCLLFLYLVFISLEIPMVLKTGLGLEAPEVEPTLTLISRPLFRAEIDNQLSKKEKHKLVFRTQERKMGEFNRISGLIFDDNAFDSVGSDEFSQLHRVVRDAFASGKVVLEDLKSGKLQREVENRTTKRAEEEPCPNSVVLSGDDFVKKGKMMVIPCGLSLGSHITVVGRPRLSSFCHFYVPIVNYNCGVQNCVLAPGNNMLFMNFFRLYEVDGQVKCEKWNRDDDSGSEESKATWWLKRLIGRTKKVTVDWPFPFAENKLFVLTLIAGLEGYHINVDGRHISSFPYRTGFTLEDATGLFMNGDVHIHSIFAASLPTSHPSTAPRKQLELSSKWKAPKIPTEPVELFIGILSAGNHFAERMAVRKSWMQYKTVKSANVVTRFFVAMHARKEVNVELMKESEYFGDIVIVPYMDNYDLVVLKTIAICEYGVRTVAAKYIMKCDDDTFVRIDAVITELNKIESGRSFYVGNINYYHKPLRHGKWAVTYEEWPEEAYPPYANGPGYIVSSDIAQYIVSEFEEHKLRLFKMEDVSMGMWVEQFNSSRPVEYVHSLKFCQFGCIEGYYTSHYQSPRQMTCLWHKLQLHGKPLCCNMR
ncbi:PREDICTED: probable beta-1,3-galactosyltransferase 19 [Erythranthe guttata]|nr:PREDICTED: probable beta-1,3-galactosyltransferase 19 [Erythranthe guttata]|eukprot:XP_012847453.1 PREDICTED: probable beta-1,3-galactosyltransferase 19 [Erythranthe guttata]